VDIDSLELTVKSTEEPLTATVERVWLDDQRLYERNEARTFQPDSERFDGALNAGLHRLVVQITGSREAPEFPGFS
jgi:hypothetical protein